MIGWLLLAAQAAAPLAPADHTGAEIAREMSRPIDWGALPPLNYRRPRTLTRAMRRFVEAEVATGRCAPRRDARGRYRIVIDVAVLVDGKGRVLRTMPHAIGCPTVEQFGAGLALSFARENLPPRVDHDDRWFRATFVFPQP